MAKTNNASLIAILVIGILSFACGAWLIFTTYTSPRYSVEGTIVHVRTVQGGKSGPTTYFGIQQADGAIVDPIAVGYIGPQVVNGNLVQVDYVVNIVTATDLVVLSGPYISWHYHYGNLYGSDLAMLGIGAALMILYWYTKNKKMTDVGEPSLQQQEQVLSPEMQQEMRRRFIKLIAIAWIPPVVCGAAFWVQHRAGDNARQVHQGKILLWVGFMLLYGWVFFMLKFIKQAKAAKAVSNTP
ncbi:MAG TPA: hypothetical protein VGB94_06025 [Acidobacteriaceae bacterium]